MWHTRFGAEMNKQNPPMLVALAMIGLIGIVNQRLTHYNEAKRSPSSTAYYSFHPKLLERFY